MALKKHQNYIPPWRESDWNKVCRDADAYWDARRRRKKAKKEQKDA